MESYICFVHCLGATEQGDILLDHFPNLFAFLTKVSNNDLNPTVVNRLLNFITLIKKKIYLIFFLLIELLCYF